MRLNNPSPRNDSCGAKRGSQEGALPGPQTWDEYEVLGGRGPAQGAGSQMPLRRAPQRARAPPCKGPGSLYLDQAWLQRQGSRGSRPWSWDRATWWGARKPALQGMITFWLPGGFWSPVSACISMQPFSEHHCEPTQLQKPGTHYERDMAPAVRELFIFQ